MKNMKKYIAIVLAVLMFAACFAACNKDDKDSGKKSDNEIPAAFEGRLMEPYIDLILSKAYTFETTCSKTVPTTF